MDDNNMDKNDGKLRGKARSSIRQNALDEWRERETNRILADPVPPPKKRKVASVDSDCVAAPSLETPIGPRFLSNAPSYAGDDPVSPDLETDAIDYITDEESESDVELDSAVEALHSMMCASEKESDLTTGTTDESLDKKLIDALAAGQSIDRCLLFSDEFVDYFSSVNVFRNSGQFNHHSSSEVALHVPCGGSRDKPTPFLYFCVKNCGYSSWLELNARLHAVNCNGETKEVKEALFACLHDGRERVFPDTGALQLHQYRTHAWESKQCEPCLPGDTTIYTTLNEYERHRLSAHDDLPEPQACLIVEKCRSEIIFTRRHQLSDHLRKGHWLTSPEIQAHMPARAESTKFPSKCIIENCDSENVWTAPAYLRQHLVKRHKYSQDEAERMVPLNANAKKFAKKEKKTTEPKKCPVIQLCESTTSFPSVSMLARDLMSGVHKMGKEKATALAEITFGKTMGTKRRRKTRKGKKTSDEDDE
jgi:hypothetical protein